jgi:DNA polymerase elongation subunit (family B)
MRAERDPARQHHLQALQNTFKILLNSFYGYLGFAQGHFADFDAAARVTQIGRDLLKKMIDWLNARGAQVIEVDTDGIYFVPPEKIDIDSLHKDLAKELPPGIDVEIDEQFDAMLSYKAKNYALLTKDGDVVIKGGALKSSIPCGSLNGASSGNALRRRALRSAGGPGMINKGLRSFGLSHPALTLT